MTVIAKSSADWKLTPNLLDYESARTDFDWATLPNLCADMGSGCCNIAHAAVDRHAEGPLAARVALRFLAARSGDGAIPTRTMTYAELGRHTRKFTNVLRALGVTKGRRVFTLLGRCPELYISILGALRTGCVVSPLYSAFGPEPIETRLALGEADVLITTATLYRRKVANIRAQLTTVRLCLVVDDVGDGGEIRDSIDFWRWMRAADERAPIEPTTAADPALLHFTSGTTGMPKGALHVHGAVAMHYLTGLYALDLHHDDIYWCTADPGWVTGVMAIAAGCSLVLSVGSFNNQTFWRNDGSHAIRRGCSRRCAVRTDCHRSRGRRRGHRRRSTLAGASRSGFDGLAEFPTQAPSQVRRRHSRIGLPVPSHSA